MANGNKLIDQKAIDTIIDGILKAISIKTNNIGITGGGTGLRGPQGPKGKDAPQIDDTQITATNPWSSKKIVETLCPTFSVSGAVVNCDPVLGSTLTVNGTDGQTTLWLGGNNLVGASAQAGTILTNYYGMDLTPVQTTTLYWLISSSGGTSLSGISFGIVYQNSGSSTPTTVWIVENGEPNAQNYPSGSFTGQAGATIGFVCSPASSDNWQQIFSAYDIMVSAGTAPTNYQTYNGTYDSVTLPTTIAAIDGPNVLYATNGNITVSGYTYAGEGTGNVNSVDDVSPEFDGNVVLSAVRYVTQTLQPAQQQLARANIGAQASLVHNYTYDGQDLSQLFTAAELHQKVSSGDFSGIQNGDYWPITLTGSFKDYASGQTKTLNNVVFKLEANINVYTNYGDTPVANHILFCSRDLIPLTLQMRSGDTTWYDDSQTNPWLGSALYQTLNASDGLQALVAATGIGAHMYAGPNDGGMRFLLESKATGATAAVSWGWGDRGKLFLPTEREVWGQDIWSEHTWGGGAAVQWPVFAGSLKHIIKGLGNGGSRYYWWCQSSYAGSAAAFAAVNRTGSPYSPRAATTWLSAPLCFLFV